ncbi:pilus assembly protein TadG-related protein [Nostocoides sp. F2B08]|uniref:pilus assembly protein TadG-related protein n=1 Tax=Nostocoides sp. F2B08 TaxID=2653936 RepID=UPI001D055E2F|nr:pilus assembly protein TadG-related protein [Tetrasphaera sp. F2B08]
MTVWMITTALTMMLCVGLAVDLSGHVHAQQRAQAIAAEAARAGGQQLHAAVAVRGGNAIVDATAAAGAARTYLAGVPDVTGTVTVASGGRVEVTTTSSYTTKILSMIGITTLPVTGEAEVDINRVLEGAPR